MINNHHFVSIIILSYNGISYLKGCLDSVIDQDYPKNKYEIIIADNGSTDGSVSFLRSNYNGLHIIEYGMNHGFAKGNNLAVKHARGDLLVFLNQDTVVHRHWLSALVTGVSNGGYGLCHSNMLLPRNDEFKGVYERKFPENIYYYELTKYGYVSQIIKNLSENDKDIIETKAVAGGSFIIKKSVLDDIGVLFDENFGMYSEDTDLALRLSQRGYKIGVIPSSVVYHFTNFEFRISRYNISKNLIMVRNRIMTFWKSSRMKDFIYLLPYLFISQSHKVFTRSTELKNSSVKSFFLACSVLPLSFMGFLWFILSVSKIGRQTHN